MKVETKYSNGAHLRRFADITGLLWRAPRTVPEVADLLDTRADVVDEGLIEKRGVRSLPRGKGGRAPQVYAWVDRDG